MNDKAFWEKITWIEVLLILISLAWIGAAIWSWITMNNQGSMPYWVWGLVVTLPALILILLFMKMRKDKKN